MIGGKRRLLDNEDWWKAKIGVKRMQESWSNEVAADEWSETKVVRKANVGEKQKSSEKTKEADPKDQPHSIYVIRAK